MGDRFRTSYAPRGERRVIWEMTLCGPGGRLVVASVWQVYTD